jgi:hypothetical protein
MSRAPQGKVSMWMVPVSSPAQHHNAWNNQSAFCASSTIDLDVYDPKEVA